MVEIAPKPISYNKTMIDDLMKSMLQDYISMVVDRFSPEKSWPEIIDQILDDELSKPHPNQSYKDMKRNMDFVGRGEYTSKSLDVTAATCLLIFHGKELGLPLNGKTASIKSYVYSLRDDRNEMSAHSNANESEYEIFEWGVVTLGHMSRFLREVYECDVFGDEARERFRRDYRNRIKQAKASLEVDYRTHLLKEKDAQEFDELLRKVLSSKNPMAFWDIANEFSDSRSPRKDPEKYVAWVRKAADAGIDSAQELLGNMYYIGYAPADIDKDWTEALKWYELIDSRSPRLEVRIASLYANGASKDHSVEEGLALIESYRDRWGIQTIKHADGVLEYQWSPKRKGQ